MDVKRVARLSKLKLTKTEEKKFEGQLLSIIDFVKQLDEVDTSKTKPTAQTTGLENVLREDEVDGKHDLTAEEALSGTEKIYNDYFVVPKVINDD